MTFQDMCLTCAAMASRVVFVGGSGGSTPLRGMVDPPVLSLKSGPTTQYTFIIFISTYTTRTNLNPIHHILILTNFETSSITDYKDDMDTFAATY